MSVRVGQAERHLFSSRCEIWAKRRAALGPPSSGWYIGAVLAHTPPSEGLVARIHANRARQRRDGLGRCKVSLCVIGKHGFTSYCTARVTHVSGRRKGLGELFVPPSPARAPARATEPPGRLPRSRSTASVQRPVQRPGRSSVSASKAHIAAMRHPARPRDFAQCEPHLRAQEAADPLDRLPPGT
jgi:hypothetical protein